MDVGRDGDGAIIAWEAVATGRSTPNGPAELTHHQAPRRRAGAFPPARRRESIGARREQFNRSEKEAVCGQAAGWDTQGTTTAPSLGATVPARNEIWTWDRLRKLSHLSAWEAENFRAEQAQKASISMAVTEELNEERDRAELNARGRVEHWVV